MMSKKRKPKSLMEVLEQFPDHGQVETVPNEPSQTRAEPGFAAPSDAAEKDFLKVLKNLDTTSAEAADPWAHRSVSMRCRTCMHWVRKGVGSLGRCRRNAPTMSGFPATFENDWCGEHKLDETKI